MSFRVALTLLLVVSQLGCQSTEPEPVDRALQDATENTRGTEVSTPNLAEVPTEVTQALLPEVPSQKEKQLFGPPRYDIKAEQIEAQAFFSGLVRDSNYSIAIHPDVAGRISLDLKQVSLQEVFELVSEIYGYDVQQKGRIIRVYPAGMRTETFPVNYLLMQRDGFSSSSITSGGVSQNAGNGGNANGGNNNFTGNNVQNGNLGGGAGGGNNGVGGNGTNISTATQTNFWVQLEEALKSMIGTQGGRSVVLSPQAGLVTVRAMPGELRAVREFLKLSEENIQRQVILEARIIELTLNDEYQQGINWQQILSHSGSTDFSFSNNAATLGNTISSSLGGVASLNFVNENFRGVLNLLSTQGNVQVLSSPRVTAVNNQKAVIKVGDDEYFVTDVSNQSTTNASTTSVTPDLELTPFFSGIALDVTPQIDENSNVLLHVHPSVIETEEQEKVVTINQQQFVLPLAQSNIRESDTVIHARSGEIVVIGGLMQSTTNDTESKTPILGDVPLLGNLFKNKRSIEQKRELVILLKPTVVGSSTWRKELKRSRKLVADWLYVE